MSKIGIPTTGGAFWERILELPEEEKLDIIEVRVGSDSDFPKIKGILTGLTDYPLLIRIASAHCTTDAIKALTKSFPNVQVSLEDEDTDSSQVSEDSRELCNRLHVVTCIAATGGLAHITGMTASDTHIPVLGFPVPNSTNGQFESDASIRNMPSHKPNGVSAYESVIVQQAIAIYNFNLESSQEIYVDPSLTISNAAQEIIDITGIQIIDTLDNNPDIGIYKHWISSTTIDYQNYTLANRDDLNRNLATKTERLGTPIAITHPVYDFPIRTDNRSYDNIVRNGFIAANRLTIPGLSMSSSVEGKTNLINSLIFAAEIIAKVNPHVKDALIKHRETFASIIREQDLG